MESVALSDANYSKEAFIAMALKASVLQFGEFTLKSGRASPYFFNLGLFYQGDDLKRLGEFYAARLIKARQDSYHLFGPAYKGLPLATATAVALAHQGIETRVSFNRKEVKTHGEGGVCMGAPLTGDIIMLDDVITAGTAFREAHHIITAHSAKLVKVIIALDRCERGIHQHSALEDIRQMGIQVESLITVYDLIEYLEKNQQYPLAEKLKQSLQKI